MTKSNLYLFLLLSSMGLFLITAHYLRYQQNIIFEQDGYQLIKVDKSQTISPHNEPIVFITESDQNELLIYKFDGYGGDFGSIDLNQYTIKNPLESHDYYFIKAFKNDLPYQQHLKDLEFEDMYEIVNSGTKFESRQLIQHNLEPGIFGYIDTMPLIFLFLGFIVFIIMIVLDFPIRYVTHKTGSLKLKFWLDLFLLLCLILVLTGIRLVPWYPSSISSIIIRNSIVILPLYFVLHFFNVKYLNSEEFWKRQFLSFLIVVLGGNLLLFIANKMMYLLDISNFDNIIHLPYFCTYNSLSIGFLFSFAVAIILKNVARLLLLER